MTWTSFNSALLVVHLAFEVTRCSNLGSNCSPGAFSMPTCIPFLHWPVLVCPHHSYWILVSPITGVCVCVRLSFELKGICWGGKGGEGTARFKHFWILGNCKLLGSDFVLPPHGMSHIPLPVLNPLHSRMSATGDFCNRVSSYHNSCRGGLPVYANTKKCTWIIQKLLFAAFVCIGLCMSGLVDTAEASCI